MGAPPRRTGTTGCAASAAGQSRAPPPRTSRRRPQTTPCSHLSFFIRLLHAFQFVDQVLHSTLNTTTQDQAKAWPQTSHYLPKHCNLLTTDALSFAEHQRAPYNSLNRASAACLRSLSRDTHLQRCPTRDSGPLFGRQEAASWLPNILSRRSSSRPAHHSQGSADGHAASYARASGCAKGRKAVTSRVPTMLSKAAFLGCTLRGSSAGTIGAQRTGL